VTRRQADELVTVVARWGAPPSPIWRMILARQPLSTIARALRLQRMMSGRMLTRRAYYGRN
jgi:hypothetical protein